MCGYNKFCIIHDLPPSDASLGPCQCRLQHIGDGSKEEAGWSDRTHWARGVWWLPWRSFVVVWFLLYMTRECGLIVCIQHNYVHLALNGALLNGHNFSSVGPIMLILWFSESLERDLSDNVLKKSEVYFWPVFDKYHGPWYFPENMARFKFGIWAYNLIELLLSFQTIIKSLNLDHHNSSYRADSSSFDTRIW